MENLPLNPVGKTLVVIGGIIIVIGLLMMFGDKIPYLGKLPGDIVIRKKNFTFYFPITTLIILNLVLLLISWLIRK
jgi:hypothetical protein